jgi:adenosine deaminase
MPLAALQRWAPAPIAAPPERFGSFEAFSAYVADHLVVHMRAADRVRALLAAALDRLRADGVVYTELSLDLRIPAFLGISMAGFARLVGEEAARVSGELTVCVEAGLNRELPLEELEPALEQAIECRLAGSVDLYGDERAARPARFRKLYDLARRHGLKLKAHAGELCGADSVREAVEELELDAVQHGIRAAEDPDVVALLAARGVAVNVCPTSNVRLGVVPDLASLPLRRLLDAGVRVTVNSDDFTVFGAGVTDELAGLSRALGLDPAAIERLVEEGLREAPAAIRSRHGVADVGGVAIEPAGRGSASGAVPVDPDLAPVLDRR